MRTVVVGGGIVGLACAVELADRGADVVVCERGSPGDGSTARAVGGIRTQFSTPVNVDLSLRSRRVWTDFEAHFGVDIGLRRTGYLFAAREAETATALRAAARMQSARGGDTRILTPTAATEVCPGLRAEEFAIATYSPGDCFADPNLALQGYLDAARSAGVDLRADTPVADVLVAGDAVGGVETPAGEIRADAVVNAAGPWASEVAAMADVDVPVVPRRRQALVAAPKRSVPETDPLTIDLDSGAYFRPERDGNAVVGGHFSEADPAADPGGFSTAADLDWTATALARAGDLATYFGPESRAKRGWAGLYAVTPDDHPVVGESRPGFYQAVGFSGHGFQHAPAVGEVVAALVAGETPPVDPAPLSGERFATGDLLAERNVA
ncbi:MAG: NAD(P)/FAD-dependent oxidoreductase [Halolamina sp.]